MKTSRVTLRKMEGRFIKSRTGRGVPSKKPEVGEMKSGDYDSVFSLWKRSENLGLSGADSPENIQRHMRRNPGLSLVARENGSVVGAILCGHDGRRGYLHHLAVDRKSRKKGIGQALVEECLARLEKLGIQRCHIFIFARNEKGKKFWRALGWRERPELRMMSIDLGSLSPSRFPSGRSV